MIHLNVPLIECYVFHYCFRFFGKETFFDAIIRQLEEFLLSFCPLSILVRVFVDNNVPIIFYSLTNLLGACNCLLDADG